jgi:hypothetical protein
VYGYDQETKVQSTTSAEQSQGAVDCFLWLSRDCASQLCTRRPNYQQTILSGSHPSSSSCSSAQETGPVGLTQLAIASWQCPGSFITPDPEFPGQTQHSSCSSKLPTLQTWPLVISGCSPKWRGHWRVPVLTAAKTSCGTRRRRWEAFKEKLSRNAPSSGRNVGLSVWSHKGPTLKGIRNWAPPPGMQLLSWPKVRYFLDRVAFQKTELFTYTAVRTFNPSVITDSRRNIDYTFLFLFHPVHELHPRPILRLIKLSVKCS